MFAIPGELVSSVLTVAGGTHSFGIVLAFGVWAFTDRLDMNLFFEGVASWKDFFSFSLRLWRDDAVFGGKVGFFFVKFILKEVLKKLTV